MRSYYSANLSDFENDSIDHILAKMVMNNVYDLNDLQRDAWIMEITILKNELMGFDEGRILFEYTIPRMGKRVDVVFLHKGIVFLLEFKTGSEEFTKAAYNQVLDYALDLKNFHSESHSRIIVPIAVSTEALQSEYNIYLYEDNIVHPFGVNGNNIWKAIDAVSEQFEATEIDYVSWENSEYMPTPTIIEAAQALYGNHNVKDIMRTDAGAQNLTLTTSTIKQIISDSKTTQKKSIIFVTGVPGAGKTLVGLNLASDLHNSSDDEHAVFLSGNHPLVTVLQEALVRDKVVQEAKNGNKISKDTARREVISFIQMIYHYRNYHFGNDIIPREKIAVFDESQRAWTHDEMASFMLKNDKIRPSEKFVRDLNFSEPGFLISTMNRHTDWAVIVCLVGGGQEINRGEAGMPEWFDSLRSSFTDWNVYVTSQIDDKEYLRDRTWEELTAGLNVHVDGNLHLSTSMRSFRSEKVSDFVKKLLDNDLDGAKAVLQKFIDKYPIFITRDLETAKNWVKEKSRGNERYGLFASSNAARLKPRGVVYARDRNSISPEKWFLNEKDDIRSSYFLEAVASEFETQGLELDYAIVAWDADLRIENGQWQYYKMSTRMNPPNWSPIRSANNITYLVNAYRVLLTRARQGFIIYLPEGVDYDLTRIPEYYDKTYRYLKSLGIAEL
ncbi:DNA/RNA helicase domain-containing protein [Sedimentibacter sp. B4]|uniref:DNA/RNA helicase domain-containing protein n=1 Tax=Sedimentibacter sp. B4 TaxID=304766 RepID=UPI0002ECB4B5|nr:DNA/RNA helicase domain-containing protein [Sedimentibacter sp. B4]